MRYKILRTLGSVGLCASLVACSSVRPMAERGVGLMENTNRSYAVRVPAYLGSLLGEAVAIPFMAILLPSYACECAFGWGVGEPPVKDAGHGEVTDSVDTGDSGDVAGDSGDYAVPLVGVPMEYGAGIGASIFAAPFAAVEEAIYGPPAPDPAWVAEKREAPPCGDVHEASDGEGE